MAARRTRVAACAILIAAVSATIVIAGTRPSSNVGLKEINYVRQPFTSLQVGTQAPLSPQQAKEQLEARGMREISPPQRRGRFAIMAATAPRGERMTLVIDLLSGEITGARLQAVPRPQDLRPQDLRSKDKKR